MKHRIAMLAVIGIVSIALTACTPSLNLTADYVKADRATYNAASPMLRQAATEHPERMQGTEDLLRSWDMRVAGAEAQYGASTTQP